MEMLSNGYGCIKKCSKTLKQSLFDWMLHKFNSILTRTMNNIPTASTSAESTSIASTSTESISTASTSTASTSTALASSSTASTSASTSQYYNEYVVPLGIPNFDVDCTTTDDSELSSDEELLPPDEVSTNANEASCIYDQSDDNIQDDKSYRSWSSTSSTVSVWRKSSSENSETEKSILKEWTPDKVSNIEDKFEDTTTPILILVQPPCETEGQMNEIGIDLINVEEHTKRLKELEKELDFIESTEWMYRPIDASIR